MANENTAYTFDTFVVSGSSRMAFDAAVAVAEAPGRTHNPLLVHGRTGSGKSHLLHAIAHVMRLRHPPAKIVCLPADAFVARIIGAIRADTTSAFRQSLLSLDALLLDDLTFPAGKERTEEEVLRRLDEASTAGVQIVVTTDAPSTASRPPFQRGTIVEVCYPDQPARVEIARRAAAARGLLLRDDALRSLASEFTESPRHLQSAIARIAAETVLLRAQ